MDSAPLSEIEQVLKAIFYSSDQVKKQHADSSGKSRLQEHAAARKQVMQQTAVPAKMDGGRRSGGGSKARRVWEERLNADKAGSQGDAESFTKEFVNMVIQRLE